MQPPRIESPADLVTSHEAICAGFLDQALEKSKAADPYVEEALEFWKRLQEHGTADEAINDPELRSPLVTAAGFSDKAQSHLTSDELDAAIKKSLKWLRGRKRGWRMELFSRYLLTRGDSLGGSMRNITGASAGRRLADAVVKCLTDLGIKFKVNFTDSDKTKTESILWDSRILLFDKLVPLIKKNVDVVLLNKGEKETYSRDFLELTERYIACGELKGGIDPAGADEHWKTAKSALSRIREAFDVNGRPKLFFVGAAIEDSMAKEIIAELNDGRLDCAANLTRPEQVESAVSWLVSL